MADDVATRFFPVRDYDLEATLTSGQTFRWIRTQAGWIGEIEGRWVRVQQTPDGLLAECSTSERAGEWGWFDHYFQLGINYSDMIKLLPRDEPMQAALDYCRGLRLLRQNPWECLAGFILSSTKQIPQIQQIVQRMGQRLSTPLTLSWLDTPVYSFPKPEIVAEAGESILRECKAGFRAPYLWEAACRIQQGELDLESLKNVSCDEARRQLMTLNGVGRKIADCVLLFAYGFQEAFPIDVWVARALHEYYFKGTGTPGLQEMQTFSQSHFGEMAGYAQQYLFHYIRTNRKT